MTITFWMHFFGKKRRWWNLGVIAVCLLFYTYIYIDLSNYECGVPEAIFLISGTTILFVVNFLREYFTWKKNNNKI